MRSSMIHPRKIIFSVCAAFVLLAPLAHGQAKLVQALASFYSPSAAIFSDDGKTLYVANAARGDYGMFAGRGAISRVAVGEDGTLKVDSPRFIEGLNSPLGLAILPAPSGPFPAGTLVVTIGGTFTVDEEEHKLADDDARQTGIAFFDLSSGKELGRVFLGRGSPAQAAVGHPIVDPTAVAADASGNIYVSDVAGAEARPLSEVEVRPGVLKFTSAAIAALAKREAPPPGSVAFALVSSIPAGLVFSRNDNALYWGTSYGLGELFRAPRGDFSAHASLQTAAKETHSIASLGITPNGTIIAARNEGDIVTWRGRGKVRHLNFHEDISFLLPGQIASTKLADGAVLVVVPELSGGGRGPWHQRVQVFTLPGNF